VAGPATTPLGAHARRVIVTRDRHAPSERASERASIADKVWFICMLRLGEGAGCNYSPRPQAYGPTKRDLCLPPAGLDLLSPDLGGNLDIF